jgi:integrase
MAQIIKRGNSYQLIANLGCDIHGKKIRKTKTWRPEDEGMNPDSAKTRKEAEKRADRYEQSLKKKEVSTSTVPKFEAFAEDWLKNIAPLQQNEQSLINNRRYAKRAYQAFDFMYIDRITTEHVQDYITELRTEGRSDVQTRKKGGDKTSGKQGERTAKTIREYVGFIRTVLNHAVDMGKLSKNPCQGLKLPKNVNVREPKIYNEEQTKHILQLLHRHEIKKHLDFVVYFTLMIYTACSRQELLGLEYKDFDIKRSIVSLRRGSKYVTGKGVYTGTLKTKYRYRSLKLPDVLMDFVFMYKAQQKEYMEKLGDKWVDKISGLGGEFVDNDRLFTQDFGNPMHPNAPALFFKRFCEKYGKENGFEYINPHGIRHTTASANIFAGMDVKTLQGLLGHSVATTTWNTYTHTFNAAEAARSAAMDKFLEVIPFPTLTETDIKDGGHQMDIKTEETAVIKNHKSA